MELLITNQSEKIIQVLDFLSDIFYLQLKRQSLNLVSNYFRVPTLDQNSYDLQLIVVWEQ